MALRDLDINVEINSFDEELRSANEECDELAASAEGAGDELDQMSAQGQAAGETTSEAMNEATNSAQGLLSTLNEAGVQFAVLAASGALWLKEAIAASSEYQLAVESLRAIADPTDFQIYMKAIREEVERTGRFFTEGQLANILRPLAASMRGYADQVVPVLSVINDKLIAMGASTEMAERVYQYLLSAVTTGAGTMLARASRMLPLPIIQSKEGIAIINQMKKELGVAGNMMLLFKAIEADAAYRTKDLAHMLNLEKIAVYRLKQTYGDFLEDVGKPYLRYLTAAANKAQGFLATLIKTGWSLTVGRVGGIATGLFGMIAGFKMLRFVAAKLGMELTTGGIVMFGLRLIGWAAAAVAVSLAIEDIWAALEGRPSLIMTAVEGWKLVPDLLNQYVRYPLEEFFTVKLPNAFKLAGHMIKEFFTVDVYNVIARAWNSILEIPGIGWVLRKMGAGELELHVHTTLTAEDYIPDIEFYRKPPEPWYPKVAYVTPEGAIVPGILPINQVGHPEGAQGPVVVPEAPVLDLSGVDVTSLLPYGGTGLLPEVNPPSEEVEIPAGVAPVGQGPTFSIQIQPGAIQVSGTDPEATAEAVKDKLKDVILDELERDLARNMPIQPR